jgi:hypothetical protein
MMKKLQPDVEALRTESFPTIAADRVFAEATTFIICHTARTCPIAE